MDSWGDEPVMSLDAAGAMLKNASSDHGDGPVEAFLRCSTVRKIEFDATTGETRSRIGRENGGALRWVDPRDGASGFAAASGAGHRALARCRSIARRSPGRPVATTPWNEVARSGLDADRARQAPDTGEMTTWLRDSAPEGLDWAWVEVGEVLETWMTSPETVQVRRRSRAWAAFMPLVDPPAARPMFLAARSWNDLARRRAREPWAERHTDPDPSHSWPEDTQLVFSPETSAFLVNILARVAHHPAAEPGAAVGSGWVLNIGGKSGLHGSDTDDAGFPVESRVLADGRHVLATWGGPGQIRRASFRDEPEPTPSSLVLHPPQIDPPRRAVWITRADIHPSGDSWLIRLEGRMYPDGAAFRPCWKRLRPSALLDACLGGVGPAHESYLGVVTPAVVFDTLLFD
jgi:hypothetical protein